MNADFRDMARDSHFELRLAEAANQFDRPAQQIARDEMMTPPRVKRELIGARCLGGRSQWTSSAAMRLALRHA